MEAQSKSSPPVGRVFEIGFATFTRRITICSDRELAVEIIAGDNISIASGQHATTHVDLDVEPTSTQRSDSQLRSHSRNSGY